MRAFCDFSLVHLDAVRRTGRLPVDDFFQLLLCCSIVTQHAHVGRLDCSCFYHLTPAVEKRGLSPTLVLFHFHHRLYLARSSHGLQLYYVLLPLLLFPDFHFSFTISLFRLYAPALSCSDMSYRFFASLSVLLFTASVWIAYAEISPCRFDEQACKSIAFPFYKPLMIGKCVKSYRN